MFSLKVFINIFEVLKNSFKTILTQLTNNVSIADFEKVLNQRETRVELITPPNILGKRLQLSGT